MTKSLMENFIFCAMYNNFPVSDTEWSVTNVEQKLSVFLDLLASKFSKYVKMLKSQKWLPIIPVQKHSLTCVPYSSY